MKKTLFTILMAIVIGFTFGYLFLRKFNTDTLMEVSSIKNQCYAFQVGVYKNKENIESTFGSKLDWERLDDKKMSRIASRLHGVSIFNREDWEDMMKFLTDTMIKFEYVLRKYIDNYSKKI